MAIENRFATEHFVNTHAANIAIDTSLSADSSNPVQNKAITEEINSIKETIADIETLLAEI